MANNLFKTPELGQDTGQQAEALPRRTGQLQDETVKTPVKTMPAVDPTSATSGMDAVIQQMYTSPEQEEKMRKASVANQRILAIGDALRHIGNIYHTVNYAPSQQFNSPVMEEQARYEKGKAVRDAANARYYSYQQAKAAQDAKQRQWEATFNYNMAKDAANLAENKRKNDAYVARQNSLAELDKARQAGVISENQYKELRNKWYPELQKATIRQKDASAAASRTRAANDSRRTTAYVNKLNGGGSGNPYVLPTKNGYISLGRDLNSNQIGKKALYGKLKDAGIVDETWIGKMDNSGYSPEEKAALLNTAISQWLMRDDHAPEYMKEHYGATFVGNQPQAPSQPAKKSLPGSKPAQKSTSGKKKLP